MVGFGKQRKVSRMSRVVHFEIHASDPEKLIAFYTALFNWSFNQWGSEKYWLISTGPDGVPGINGGLLQRHGDRPVPGQAVNAFGCTVDVENLDSVMALGVEIGGTVALEKMAIPGVGWLGYLMDPDGNIFGLMQNDPAAA